MYLPFNKKNSYRSFFGVSAFLLRGIIWTALVTGIFACQENDDVPPVITLTGEDTVFHILNTEYVDPGATATDETDGDLTSNIFIDNTVDEDRIGEYAVHYRVVDNAGNEASELSRIVNVYNEALPYLGDYLASEIEEFPASGDCSYPVYIWQDSVVNNRIVFFDFACGIQREVYAEIEDSLLEIPLQLIQDSVIDMAVQGFGSIKDSLAVLKYTRTDSTGVELWQATFNRVK